MREKCERKSRRKCGGNCARNVVANAGNPYDNTLLCVTPPVEFCVLEWPLSHDMPSLRGGAFEGFWKKNLKSGGRFWRVFRVFLVHFLGHIWPKMTFVDDEPFQILDHWACAKNHSLLSTFIGDLMKQCSRWSWLTPASPSKTVFICVLSISQKLVRLRLKSSLFVASCDRTAWISRSGKGTMIYLSLFLSGCLLIFIFLLTKNFVRPAQVLLQRIPTLTSLTQTS